MIEKINYVSITIPVKSHRAPYVCFHRGNRISTLCQNVSRARLEQIGEAIFNRTNSSDATTIICDGHISVSYRLSN